MGRRSQAGARQEPGRSQAGAITEALRAITEDLRGFTEAQRGFTEALRDPKRPKEEPL